MPKLGMEPIRRAAVINAALLCIGEKGTGGITLDLVAQRAGCSKGVVAYYFKSKQGLVLECLKAFFTYYGVKIAGDIRQGMSAAAMLQTVVNHSLPPLGEAREEPELNVSPLEGPEAMHIPADMKAKLFIQFFSLAMTDMQAQEAITEIYGKDVKGIAQLVGYGVQSGEMRVQDPAESAYTLLAMMVGLSVFRVAGFLPPGQTDNRIAAVRYLESLARGAADMESGGDRNDGRG
jgi:AcrR family transcriptional regulator